MQLADIAFPAFQKCYVSQTNKKCRKNRRASRGVEDGEKPNREQESSIVRREGKKRAIRVKVCLGSLSPLPFSFSTTPPFMPLGREGREGRRNVEGSFCVGWLQSSQSFHFLPPPPDFLRDETIPRQNRLSASASFPPTPGCTVCRTA